MILRIRNVADPDAQRFRRAAAARGITQAAYLTALLDLHDHIRDTGDARLAAWLDDHQLNTITA